MDGNGCFMKYERTLIISLVNRNAEMYYVVFRVAFFCSRNPKLGQSDLVYWVIGHLAYIAVLSAEHHSHGLLV